MSFETNTVNPYPLDKASQIGAEKHDRLATLHANGAFSGEERETLLNSMDGFSDAVFAATGVNDTDGDRHSFKERIGGYEVTKVSRFNLAVGVADEANSLGFTLEGDDEQATEQAKRLIDDYDMFVEPRVTGKGNLPADYGRRQTAKLLLVESSARNLARRIGVTDPVLDSRTIAAIKEKTGIDFYELRHGYHGPDRQVEHVRQKRKEAKNHYSGPVGSSVVVSGLGSTVITGYNQYGKPMVRGKDGRPVSTFGRL